MEALFELHGKLIALPMLAVVTEVEEVADPMSADGFRFIAYTSNGTPIQFAGTDRAMMKAAHSRLKLAWRDYYRLMTGRVERACAFK